MSQPAMSLCGVPGPSPASRTSLARMHSKRGERTLDSAAPRAGTWGTGGISPGGVPDLREHVASDLVDDVTFTSASVSLALVS